METAGIYGYVCASRPPGATAKGHMSRVGGSRSDLKELHGVRSRIVATEHTLERAILGFMAGL